ncbi:hypothetical protein CLU81_3967 [Flavobacterium sp. 9]|uniref:hypothetical protein n=1 Tax=Flavobacterium sp. 9 TaxID=2035198 RepID=UPI000C19B1F9|nr:hypothetical protein [Flavobacterium sp. 9]PIF33362.1 hypothetical protein CLU81_3967 [Flavobacterium sp. 9]
MKLQNRFFAYIILLVVYYFSTILLMSVDSELKINHLFITLGFGFTIINLVYSFFILKWTPLFNIGYSIIIAAVSLVLALKFGDLHLFSQYDPYDIETCIIANAIFSVVFWEVAYQTKKI